MNGHMFSVIIPENLTFKLLDLLPCSEIMISLRATLKWIMLITRVPNQQPVIAVWCIRQLLETARDPRRLKIQLMGCSASAASSQAISGPVARIASNAVTARDGGTLLVTAIHLGRVSLMFPTGLPLHKPKTQQVLNKIPLLSRLRLISRSFLLLLMETEGTP
jgi:hypothetical protein